MLFEWACIAVTACARARASVSAYSRASIPARPESERDDTRRIQVCAIARGSDRRTKTDWRRLWCPNRKLISLRFSRRVSGGAHLESSHWPRWRMMDENSLLDRSNVPSVISLQPADAACTTDRIRLIDHDRSADRNVKRLDDRSSVGKRPSLPPPPPRLTHSLADESRWQL